MTRTITLPDLVDAPPADDLFQYGSRTVLCRQPDGELISEQVPLTIWDVLHPQEGDHIVQSSRHAEEVCYLSYVIRDRIAEDKRALLLSDQPIYWDRPGLSHHAPDIALFLQLLRRKDHWPSFHVAVEGRRPELIIEVVSPNIRGTDTVTKLAEYHLAEVPMYVVVDREKEEDWPTIRGYVWEPDGYRELARDDRDCLLLPMLNLRICGTYRRVTLRDARTDREVGDYTVVTRLLEQAEQARQVAEEAARLAEEKQRQAEDEAYEEAALRRKAEARARQEAEERQKAEDRARHEADERQKAEDRARHETEERRRADEECRKAEDRARHETEERRKAEDRARLADTARADMERRLLELEAKLREKTGS